VAEAGRRTTSRRELQHQPGFDDVSPQVGEFDADAFDRLMREQSDLAMSLLAAMANATDEALGQIARQLAGRVLVDLARSGPAVRRGIGRLHRRRGDDGDVGGDIDLDASLEAILRARGAGRPPRVDELTVAAWTRPDTAVCLLVDRSGSMTGERLVRACVAAAAVALRARADCSVIAFSDDAVVLCSQGEARAAEELVDDLLALRGHGPTNLELGLRVASEQLARTRAPRRLTLVFTDGRATTGGHPTGWPHDVGELVILAPEDDTADAADLAATLGARCVPYGTIHNIPDALADALAP
jgi:Mg-chelatase subunit ChlD